MLEENNCLFFQFMYFLSANYIFIATKVALGIGFKRKYLDHSLDTYQCILKISLISKK